MLGYSECAAIDTDIHIPLWHADLESLEFITRVVQVDHMIVLFLVFFFQKILP